MDPGHLDRQVHQGPASGASVTVPVGTEVATADGIVFTTTHAVTVDARRSRKRT